MISISMTAEQAGRVADHAIAAIGREAWYRCTYTEGNLQVPEDLVDSVQAIDPAAVSASALIAYAANKRWGVETGGITIAGIPVATDDRSKLMIAGASIAAGRSEDWETIWHGADGGTYPIGSEAMLAISAAVEAHVNATFAVFAQVKADIEAGEITTTDQIDAAFA